MLVNNFYFKITNLSVYVYFLVSSSLYFLLIHRVPFASQKKWMINFCSFQKKKYFLFMNKMFFGNCDTTTMVECTREICVRMYEKLFIYVAGRLNRWVNIRKHKAKSTRSTSCAWLTFNFANGLRIWSVSLLRCVPEILSISRLLSGTKMPNGMLVMSAIDNDRSSVRFWNTGRISNKFNCTFPLILRVCSLGNWHM